MFRRFYWIGVGCARFGENRFETCQKRLNHSLIGEIKFQNVSFACRRQLYILAIDRVVCAIYAEYMLTPGIADLNCPSLTRLQSEIPGKPMRFTFHRCKTLLTASALICLVFYSPVGNRAAADEGMWLFNQLPRDELKSKYDFEPSAEWADKLMRASVRFNVGGSASFVSSNGLVLTNQHVGSDTVQKLSNKDNNYYKNGFLARSLDQELKAPDLELNQLLTIVDVTNRVNSVIRPGMSVADAFAARRAVIATIEQEATEETGNRCDVVTLYGGGRYHLYQFKKYTDVRLVWAPEAAAAFFGGDADNFEYPRYCLDACIFRVYENDRPAKIKHFLKWNDDGPADGELVFVSGNPGSTSRIYTTAALKYERDHRMPYVLNFIYRREILLQQFGLQGEEYKRIADDELLSFQNSRKAYKGMLAGPARPWIHEIQSSGRIQNDRPDQGECGPGPIRKSLGGDRRDPEQTSRTVATILFVQYHIIQFGSNAGAYG